MSIENWSDSVIVVDLQDDPAFTDDLNALMEQLELKKGADVVLRLDGVTYLNSSNLARLLKTRKTIQSQKRKLVLCEIATTVWGLFLVTGLDKVFEFADDLPSALTMVQIAAK